MRAPTPLFDFQDAARSGQFTPVGQAASAGEARCRAVVTGGGLRFEGQATPGAAVAAAIRSSPAPLDLGGATGVALRVRGDGRRYALALGADGAAWEAHFETATGGWEVVLLPLELFEPTAPEAGPLRPERIRTVALRVVDGQAGPFRLEISAVAGYAVERGALAFPRPASP